MPSYRTARATEDVRRELTDIMRTLKDPRVQGQGMLSIVNIELSNDYSHCKVYVSSMEGLDKAVDAVAGLESASGHIRREIGSRLRLRKTPQFHFVADNGIEQSAAMGEKMRSLGLLEDTGEQTGETDEQDD